MLNCALGGELNVRLGVIEKKKVIVFEGQISTATAANIALIHVNDLNRPFSLVLQHHCWWWFIGWRKEIRDLLPKR